MKTFVKNFLTFIICGGCAFTCLIFFILYLIQIDELRYSSYKLTNPKITEVSAEPLDKEYEELNVEGMKTYLLKIKVENPYALGIDADKIHFIYNTNAYGDYDYMISGEAAFEFGTWDRGYYIKPGETCTLFRLIAIDDACEKFDLILLDYEYEDKQTVTVNL